MLKESTKGISVCVFIPSLQSGGAEKQAMLLAKALNDECNTYLVIWRGQLVEPKFAQYIEKNGINAVYLGGNVVVRLFRFVKFLRSHSVKFLFAFLASTNFYGALAGKLGGVKYIIGGIRNSEIPRFKFLLQRFLHNHLLSYTIFNNYSGKDNLVKQGFKGSTCYVIPNCFELDNPSITRPTGNSQVIVSLARFVEQKDYPTAIRAIDYLVRDLIKDRSIRFEYRIIGYGVLEEQIRALVQEYGMESYIRIIINPPDIPAHLREADIFLTTSLFEGTSNSMMEAMSYSLPIVATDAGDNNRLIENGTTGFLCNIGDYRQIANRIYELLTNSEQRVAFGHAGYQKLEREYTMERFREHYQIFMNQLLNPSVP